MVAHHQGRRHQAAVKAVAARLGFAFDRTMIFVKAGGAWAHDKHEMISFITPFVTIRADETRYGWMFGTGVEHAFFGNWSAKVEYDYLDLGTRSLHFPGLAGHATLRVSAPVGLDRCLEADRGELGLGTVISGEDHPLAFCAFLGANRRPTLADVRIRPSTLWA